MASFELDVVGVVSMLYTVVTFCGSYFVAWSVLGARYKLPRTERHVVAWLLWDILVHTTIEGPFVVISLLGTVKDSTSFFSAVWKEYGKADARWLVSDPTIVALEVATVFFVTPMCVALVYAICKDRHYRHFVQISLCVCELYGGWMTFVPELLDGSRNLETENFVLLYVYLVFYNGIWVVVPGLLLLQSWNDLKKDQRSTDERSATSTLHADSGDAISKSAAPASHQKKKSRQGKQR